jgi:biopolymer transport protein ExbD
VVKRGSEIVVNDTPVSLDELFVTLTNSTKKSTDSLVIIHADQDVAHGIVVRVMDTAKRAGFTRLAIATAVMNKSSLGEKRK